ncbi:PH domain-containing protein [archaeon]|nr:PH domain-containing protein [archaeon]MBL7056847.1 PH domain-containing protein [Candidatus Woesearchaeota archaeon]
MPTVFRPNTHKVLLMNFLKMLTTIVIVIIILIILEFTTTILHTIAPLHWLIITIVIIGLIILLLSQIAAKKVQYAFFDDKLKACNSILFLFKKTKNVSYQNISQISYDNTGFFNRYFGTGTIILDLSRQGAKELKMKRMDEPAKKMERVQEVLRSFQLKTQAQYTEKHRMKDVLDGHA